MPRSSITDGLTAGALDLCAKGCFGSGRAFVQGLFLNGLEAVLCNLAFFHRDFTKQYHVMSHMLLEPEILASVQADC